MRAACRVVVSSSRGVRESVVGVVNELELAGSRGALGRVRGDAVGVRLQRCAFVGVADLLRGCRGWDVEDGVCGGGDLLDR